MLTLIIFIIDSIMGANAGFIYIGTFIMDMCIFEFIGDRIKEKRERNNDQI